MLKVEFVTIGVVIVYMVLIFLDLMLDKETRPGQVNAIADGRPWTKAFMWIDLVFLVIFTLELFIRIFAFGYYYFWNALNVIDGLVVFTSFVLQVWIITLVDEVVDEGAAQAQGVLGLLRLLRLVRLFVVMNKVQKARDAYRKTKYLKLGARAPPLAPRPLGPPSPTLGLGPCRRLGSVTHAAAAAAAAAAAGAGSPVEKVIELLGEMKGKDGLTDEDQKDIQWIMDLIASDKLYTINTNNLLGNVKDKGRPHTPELPMGWAARGGAGRGGHSAGHTPYVATAPAQRSLLRRAEMSDFLQQEVGIKGGLDLDGDTSVANSDDLTSLSQAQLSVSRFSLDARRRVPRWRR